MTENALLLGDSATGEVALLTKRANRHGLISGATGTGKTVTLQRLAETMAMTGIPVFVCDVKGDLSGIAARKEGGFNPAILWDVMGASGHPTRTTISEFGPLLLARLLDLNDTQTGVLNVCFRVADEQGLLLLDLKDLRALLDHVSQNAKSISSQYGLVSPTSVAAIQRAILSLENEDAGRFFGEPPLALPDLMRTNPQGRGIINILVADQLIQRPRLYTTFLLWLLSELFEDLPEAGDLPQPKLCLFFDEAHLLFNDMPKVLLEKIEQVVRLIRSKGVGVYFITQNPTDIPLGVAAQLGNRIQHALRAFTPADQKTVKAAADTFRPNPAFDIREAITQLAVGEALVSLLDATGAPSITERVKIRLPESRLGPLTAAERQQLIAQSPVAGQYDRVIDRESAYERLTQRIEQNQQRSGNSGSVPQTSATQPWGTAATEATPPSNRSEKSSAPRRGDDLVTAIAKSALRAAASQAGRSLMRGLLGNLLRG